MPEFFFFFWGGEYPCNPFALRIPSMYTKEVSRTPLFTFYSGLKLGVGGKMSRDLLTKIRAV